MFQTFDVVNKESTIITDSHNRKIQGFRLSLEKEVVNLDNLAFAKKVDVAEKYSEYAAYPTDITPIKDKELCLLTFNFGNVSSERVVVYSFEDLMNKLQS